MAAKPGIVIRLMTPADFGAVYHLGCDCYTVLDKPYNWWSITEVADHLQNHGDCCWVAESEGRVVGFLLGARDFELITDTGHLEWLAVHSEFRGRGVATALMEQGIDHYRRLGRSYVVGDVSSENAASRGLLGRLGFEDGITVAFFRKKL